MKHCKEGETLQEYQYRKDQLTTSDANGAWAEHRRSVPDLERKVSYYESLPATRFESKRSIQAIFRSIHKGPDGAESGEFCRGQRPPDPRSRQISVIFFFCQKQNFVNNDVVHIQPSRNVELGTLVCTQKATCLVQLYVNKTEDQQ